MAERPPAVRRPGLLTIVVALVVLLALAIWQGAPHLARRTLFLIAEASDLEPRSIEVRHLGWRRAEIRNVVLGEGREIEIRTITARYAPLDILRLRFEHILVEDLRLRANVDRDGLAPGVLASLMAGGGGLSIRCEDLRLEGGRLEVASPLGTARARVDGEAALRGPAGVSLRGALRADGDRITARIAFEPSGRPPSPSDEAGPLPPGRGTLEFSARDASLAGVAAGVDASARFDLVAGREEIRIDLPAGASLEADTLEADLMQKVGAPPALDEIFAAPLAIAIDAAGGDTPLLRARRKAGGWQIAWAVSARARDGAGASMEADSRGSMAVPAEKDGPMHLALSPLALEVRDWTLPAGRIAAATIRLEGEGPPDAFEGRLQAAARGQADAGEATGRVPLQMALRAGVALAGASLRVTPEECLMLELGGFGLGDLGRAEALTLCLAATPAGPLLTVTREADEALTLALRGALRPAPVRIRTAGRAAALGTLEGETPALVIAFDRDAGGEPRFSLEGEGGALRSATAGLLAESAGFSLAGRLGDNPETKGSWRVGRIAGVGKRPLLAPVALSGSIDLADREITFTGEVKNSGGSLSLKVDGTHSLEDGKGSARIALAPLRFKPGGLRLREIVPALRRDVYGTRGSVDASGSFRWGPGFLQTPLRLRVRDLSLVVGAIGVKGLRGELRLRHSLPPEAAAGQEFEVERIDTLIAITDGRVVFGVEKDGRIDIATFEAGALGGQFSGSGWALRTGDDGSLQLDLGGIQVSELMAAVDLAGLTGTGEMSGVFPIEIRDGRPIVRGASLRATVDGGWIRYRPDARPAAFPRDNPQLDRVLAILEDFRYDNLVLSLDGPLLDELVARVELRGSNPAYANGQPVELSLNLTTRLYDLFRNTTATTRIGETLGRRLREGDGGQAE